MLSSPTLYRAHRLSTGRCDIRKIDAGTQTAYLRVISDRKMEKSAVTCRCHHRQTLSPAFRSVFACNDRHRRQTSSDENNKKRRQQRGRAAEAAAPERERSTDDRDNDGPLGREVVSPRRGAAARRCSHVRYRPARGRLTCRFLFLRRG